MNQQIKTHICSDINCHNEYTKYRSTDKYCSYDCKKKNFKPKQKKYHIIPKKTKKKAKADAKYLKVRFEFMNSLESQICPVFINKSVTDVHHMKGKEGFADDWARDNDVPLLIDIRFFLAVSRAGHDKIENNPIWAKEMGYSVDRLA